jgi:hypothetical protein
MPSEGISRKREKVTGERPRLPKVHVQRIARKGPEAGHTNALEPPAGPNLHEDLRQVGSGKLRGQTCQWIEAQTKPPAGVSMETARC